MCFRTDAKVIDGSIIESKTEKEPFAVICCNLVLWRSINSLEAWTRMCMNKLGFNCTAEGKKRIFPNQGTNTYLDLHLKYPGS